MSRPVPPHREGGAAVRMEMTDSGCLKVWLSEEDLAELGLTFESLDYEDPVTRDAMKRILAAAVHPGGRPPAQPDETGSGALCV